MDRNRDKCGIEKLPSALGLMAYAAPIGAAVFLLNPTYSILPGIYAKYFGLELATIGIVLFVGRLFDGITDPVIGYLSDRNRVIGGSRKTFVTIGSAGLLLSGYFLFIPPAAVSIYYYLVWSMLFFLAWTSVDIPHNAWGAELTGQYDARATVFSFRIAFVYVGVVMFFALPLLPINQSPEYTPRTLKIALCIAAILMVTTLTVNHFFAPENRVLGQKDYSKPSPRKILKLLISNKPLIIFLITFFFAGVSLGMWTGLLFVYLDGYLALGNKVVFIFLIGNILGLLSIPMWLKLTKLTSKSTVWGVGVGFYAMLLLCCLYVDRETTWWVPFILVGGKFVGTTCLNALAPAILGDIADYGSLKSGRSHGALYYALYGFLVKVTMGVGAGLALWVAGHFGFEPNNSDQLDNGILGIRLGFIILPAVAASIACLLIIFTPISKRRHQIIQRRLVARSFEGGPKQSYD